MLTATKLLKQKLALASKSAIFLWILLICFGNMNMSLEAQEAKSTESALYISKGKRDPFVPLVTLTSKTPSGIMGVQNPDEVNIEGVVYDPKAGSIVLINGAMLKEGQEIGPVKVVQVRPNGAVLSVNGVEAFRPIYTDKNKQV